MAQLEGKNKYWLGIASAGIIFLAAVFSRWLAQPPISEAKIRIFRQIPFPLALVNNRPVFMKAFLAQYELANIYFNKYGQYDGAAIRQKVNESLINEEKARQLAAYYNVTVNAKDVQEEFNHQKESYVQNGQPDFIAALANFGLSEKSYKKIILEPQILYVNLATWFNGQKDLNRDGFALADSLAAKISAGTPMETLATRFSEDERSKAVEGDMGFVQITAVFPELQESLDAARAGQVLLLASRAGLHIFKVEEKDSVGRAHLRQIFIRENNFQTWYQNQIKNYKVKQIVKI